ncbi:MAG TPA: polyphenol oxidase family protein [Acidimicrobiales bacterium]|nr:polyphenol oxidase family protein [Acidimicrobiales bacterium]
MACCTTVADGDLRPEHSDEAARRAIADLPWRFCAQVHGTTVARTGAGAGRPVADALVTTDDVALALLGADCALVALASPEGVRGVAHAGWRGLAGGVIEKTAAAMRELGASEIAAVSSPAIHPECYAFSPADLEALVAVLGEEVRATTADGEPALDLPRGVAGALARAGVTDLGALGGCTGCDERFYSFRRRGEAARHALVLRPAPSR